MIYITGDCHSDVTKLNKRFFPEQNEMTKDDTVIVCGDFGLLWTPNSVEQNYNLDELNRRSFTTIFVDGNHENFDMLNALPVVDFHGAKAHKVRSSIFHIMRGEVFELDDRKFFAFGGARSHDIQDGIIDPADYTTSGELKAAIRRANLENKMFRVKGYSWWSEEMPNESEMVNGLKNLKKVDYSVDFVVSHCLPSSMQAYLLAGKSKPDELTEYFENLLGVMKFKKWFCGHYHRNEQIFSDYLILYEQIIRIA